MISCDVLEKPNFVFKTKVCALGLFAFNCTSFTRVSALVMT